MAKGKSQYATWRCSKVTEEGGVCNKPAKKNSYYNKRGEGEILREKSMFCSQCREHNVFKMKDTKKGN